MNVDPAALEPQSDQRTTAPSSAFSDMMTELEAMVRYAAENGISVPPAVMEVLEGRAREDRPSPVSRELMEAYQLMAAAVAPAKPGAIVATQRAGAGGALGDIRLLRGLMLMGLLSAAGYAGFSIVLDQPEPFPLGQGIVEQGVYLFAAALGASFYALFTAHRYVVDRTFDPSYTVQYWVRFALGVLAGIVLANVVTSMQAAGPEEIPIEATVVAILGGYSADVVNRILTRLVETLEALIAGRSRRWLEQQRHAIEAEARAEKARKSLEAAQEIMRLEGEISNGLATGEARERLKELADQLLDDVRS